MSPESARVPRAVVVGGWLALAGSAVLLTVAISLDAVNPLTLWTILVGIVGGLVALRGRRRAHSWTAALLVLVAALPALPGGLGFAYAPSLVVLLVGGMRGKPRRPPSRTDDAG